LIRALFTGVAAVLTVAAASTDARANPLDTFGFGSRSTAMGGAVSADVRDWSANYYNPAGLALATGLEIGIGYFRADHDLYINGKNSGVDPVKGMVAGIVAPGKLYDLPFAFGFGLHLPDDRLSRVEALPQTEPRWELYANRNQRVYLAANLAISPFEWLQLGGGLSFMSSTTGTLDISGDANILKVDDSQLRHAVDASLSAIRYPQLGARIKLGKRAALAVAYRGQFSLALDIKARLHGDISLGPPPPTYSVLYDLNTASVDSFLPQQLVVGGSWQLLDNLHVNLDATWINWSAYVPPVSTVGVALDFNVPASVLQPFGIMLPTVPAATQIVPISMHDRVNPRLGFEWRAFAKPKWEGFLRGGYEYAKSPIPPQTGVTNYVDRDRHSISAGLGARLMAPMKELPGDVRLDAHAQLSELPTGTTLKSNPADTTGDYTAGGHIWNVGVSATLGF
jgi:long-chain fatty acid transport protein